MSSVSFDAILSAVVDDIVEATNAYVLVTEFAFPIVRQQQLRDHFPFFVDNLLDAFRGQVLITVCRLFDPREDHRNASLSTLLRGVVAHHSTDSNVESPVADLRRRYDALIPKYLADIQARWKPLAIHRSAYLAHRDLSKKPPDMLYRDLRECFEWAQAIVAGYFGAYRSTTRLFGLHGLDKDAAHLLEWCRLDDYSRHFREQMESDRRRLTEGHLP